MSLVLLDLSKSTIARYIKDMIKEGIIYCDGNNRNGGHATIKVFKQLTLEERQSVIDCGACFNGGKLACLCLDTLEEFYV